jgi:two-component system NtrC family sensor kinase
MKRLFLPLFWKFSIALIVIVFLFGFTYAFLIWKNVSGSLQKELQKRGLHIAHSLAEQAIDPILFEDYLSLQNMVDNIREIDSTLAYVFIMNNRNEVIVHNLQQGVPAELLNANSLQDGQTENVVLIRPKGSNTKIIRDIAIPVLEGKIGTIRMGIGEEIIQTEVKKTIQTLLILLGIFLLMGILGVFIFVQVITNPIKVISNVADRLDFNTLKGRAQPQITIRNKYLSSFWMFFRARDELDSLAERFNIMIKRLENAYNELEAAHAELIQSEKLASVGTLAAGIAHEINNPINGIQNCIRRILKSPKNFKQNQQYFFMMDEAAIKIERVVRGLLDYSRRENISFDEINIKEVIENVLLLVSYEVDKSGISVTKEFLADSTPILGSFNHLEQVFVNLFINCIDSINEKSKLDPDCERQIKIITEQQNSQMAIHIEDSGTGISEEIQEKIFDPFYTTKLSGLGTGLGLSVCYNIIRSHNGDIQVKSQLGQGTIFTILLPFPKIEI